MLAFTAPLFSPLASLRSSSSLYTSCPPRFHHPAPHFGSRLQHIHMQPRASTSPPVIAAPLTLNLSDSTTLKLRFTPDAASKLSEHMNNLVKSFQKLQKATEEGRRRTKEDSLEYMYQSDDGLRLTLECNPNLFSTAFQAKVYVNIDDGNVSVSSEIMLTKLVDGIKTYKAGNV
eukprot:Plantae.Rhodophyta-Hildenbrandia_rubra.ctg20522.p1 GENE.Plantae.Rhodophyta-Hildenbrandia_rubra.ctg20522~~Plantae.Rhodophyta-Hildenbrandia_rubra.ctg20522.p1  ORF type:complete len:174 (+),score=18.01 Plantae.Rhodophyta-Hildenbrandia_rubra.ctg20522:1265-1786(+)